jgi:hypothetical protein
MSFIIDVPTEQTTAVTDICLALFALTVSLIVYKTGHSRDLKKARIWAWAFALLTIASIFGAAAHGLKMTEHMNFILWQPINCSLGLTIALFTAGVVYDLRGFSIPSALIVVFLLAGLGFYMITIILHGAFIIFILYEAVAMLFALISYWILALRKKQKGYWFMWVGILVTIVAAGIQVIESIRLTIIWEFDHNGIFHIVQMIGLVFLLTGLRSGFLSSSLTRQEFA